MSSLTFQYLRDLQQKERLSPELQEIDRDFYTRVAEYVSRKTKLAMSGNEFTDEREFQKMVPVIQDIFNRRETKIAQAAMKAARSGDRNIANLLPEEEVLFTSIKECLEKNRERLNGILTGKGMPSFVEVALPPKQTEPKQEDARQDALIIKMSKLKMLEDVPSFVAEDLNVYGPWKKDEVVDCPEKASEMFLAIGKAEKIDSTSTQPL